MYMHNENNDNKGEIMMMGRGDASYKQRCVEKLSPRNSQRQVTKNVSIVILLFVILYGIILGQDGKLRSHFAISTNFSVRAQSSPVESPCRDRFSCFKPGNTSLEDKPRRGRPLDFDDHSPLVAVEGEESLTPRMMANNFNVAHSTIVRRLKKLKRSICDCAGGNEFFYENYRLLVKFNSHKSCKINNFHSQRLLSHLIKIKCR
ncbi:hypothetical protein GQX74_009031 [Glossina fuscipes]|nr:hypothetical protein GQX74_009031 [Glossina fuscipes]